jgi:hypothetical protein
MLQPGYEEMKCDAVVAIALVHDRKAEIGFQHIGSRSDLEEGCRQPLVPTIELNEFYSPERCASLHDQAVSVKHPSPPGCSQPSVV